MRFQIVFNALIKDRIYLAWVAGVYQGRGVTGMARVDGRTAEAITIVWHDFDGSDIYGGQRVVLDSREVKRADEHVYRDGSMALHVARVAAREAAAAK